MEKRFHFSYVIYEKASRLGGTWWENKYPGVACDIPSHLYSFSFYQNPYWSQEYSKGKEIHNYLEQVNDQNGYSRRKENHHYLKQAIETKNALYLAKKFPTYFYKLSI